MPAIWVASAGVLPMRRPKSKALTATALGFPIGLEDAMGEFLCIPVPPASAEVEERRSFDLRRIMGCSCNVVLAQRGLSAR